jgi:phosphatidate cytidylyltransferase
VIALADKMSTRTIVGLCLTAAIVGLLVWDHLSGHAWGLGLLAITLVTWGGREIAKLLTAAGAPTNKPLLMGACVVLMVSRVVGEELRIPALVDAESGILIVFLFALMFPPLVGTPSRERFLGIAATVFGLMYVWFLGSYVVRLRYLPGIGESAAFYAILVSKGSDVTAYFTGKLTGRTKLIPSISPGKTVAGFVGGILGAIGITAGCCAWTPLGTAFPLRFSVPIGIILGLVSIAGDLVESLFKRSAELKDSARLLPTFGGVLDVTDSIMTAAPATYYLIALMKPLSGVA